MSAIDNTPSNRNFLSPLNFKFQIKKAPHVNFFIQKVNIPGITLGAPEIANPFVKYPIPGDHLKYNDLEITFKVDEDLKNYLEIQNWIQSLGKPESYAQYKAIRELDKTPGTGEGVYSDISLIVLSSTKMANYEIVFVDGFPVDISSVIFNTTDQDLNYVTASAVFKYSYFNINKI